MCLIRSLHLKNIFCRMWKEWLREFGRQLVSKMYEFRFPDVGEGITEGRLVKWLVKLGDTVKVDSGLADISTDKATVEIPSPVTGKILELSAKENSVIHVGEVI